MPMSTVRASSLPTACVVAAITLNVPGYAGIVYGLAFLAGLAWLVLSTEELRLYRTYRQFRWLSVVALRMWMKTW